MTASSCLAHVSPLSLVSVGTISSNSTLLRGALHILSKNASSEQEPFKDDPYSDVGMMSSSYEIGYTAKKIQLKLHHNYVNNF